MANLPETKTKESTDLARRLTVTETSIYTAIRLGFTLKDLAKKAYPPKKGSKKQLRERMHFLMRLEAVVARSEPLQQAISNAAQANLIESLPAVTEAVAGRAKRTGRADVVKLVFEASGFHNPRVQHEHSGDIEIKLTMPRPQAAVPSGSKLDDVDSAGRQVGPTTDAAKTAD